MATTPTPFMPNAQNLMMLGAMYGGFGGGGGMGGMGGFNPMMYMDPRVQMRMGLAQNLMQQGTQAGPTLSRLSPFSHLAQALTGGMMMRNLYGEQQQDSDAQAKAQKATFDKFGALLGDIGTPQRDAWEAMDPWEKNLVIIQKGGDILSTYGGLEGAKAKATGYSSDAVQQAITAYHNTIANNPNLTQAEKSLAQQSLAKQVAAEGFQLTFDDQGGIHYAIIPGGKADPNVIFAQKQAEANAGVGAATTIASAAPRTVKQGEGITSGAQSGVGGTSLGPGNAPITPASPPPTVNPEPNPVNPTPAIPASPAFAKPPAAATGGGQQGGGTNPPPPAPPPPAPPPAATGGPPPPPPPPPTNTGPPNPPLQPTVPPPPPLAQAEDLGQLTGGNAGIPGAGRPGPQLPASEYDPNLPSNLPLPALAPGRGGPPIAPAAPQTPPPPPVTSTAPAVTPAAPSVTTAPAAPGGGGPFDIGSVKQENKGYNRSDPLAGLQPGELRYGPDNDYLPGMKTVGGGSKMWGPLPGPQSQIDKEKAFYDLNATNANNAQQGRQYLDSIKHALTVLNDPANKGWHSGDALAAKAELVGSYNSLMDNFLDPNRQRSRMGENDIANYDMLVKNSDRLGLDLGGGTGTGTQNIVGMAMHAVPRAALRPLSLRVLASSVDQQFQRWIDKHDFQDQVANQPGNVGHIMVGSNDAFDRIHPPVYYADKAVYNAMDPKIVQLFHSKMMAPGADRAQLEAWMDQGYGNGMAKFIEQQIAQGIYPQL